MGVPPKDSLRGTVYSESKAVLSVVESQSEALGHLAGVLLTPKPGKAAPGEALGHTADFDLSITLPEDRKAALRRKLEKQLGQLEKAARGARGRLGNETFLDRAPAHVVGSLREKLGDYDSQIERVRATLSGL